jgi:nitrate/nitrite-specific signal transduction histidine kinase
MNENPIDGGEIARLLHRRTNWLALLHAVTRAVADASTRDDALKAVLTQVCESEDWQAGTINLPDRHRPGSVAWAVTYGGSPLDTQNPTRLVLPITIGHEVVAEMELLSVRPHEQSTELDSVMSDICDHIARVIERERTTAQAADLVLQEQQALLHTLHDSLGQTLTGLGMLSNALRQRLSGADAAGVELTVARVGAS